MNTSRTSRAATFLAALFTTVVLFEAVMGLGEPAPAAAMQLAAAPAVVVR
jgi:hypothetical protein